MPRTGFDPRAHGFHFANDFVDKVVTVSGFGEVATEGRAGGMAFAALDYWFAGLPVPSHRPEDFPDRAVPEDGTRLADFIHKRLFDSYATWSARQFLTWALAEDHPTWSSPGVAAMTAEELPRARRSLDAGRPVVLGLVAARALDEVARNRQVVAYGYDKDGAGPIRLFVYDSHHSGTEVVLAPEPDGGWASSARWRPLAGAVPPGLRPRAPALHRPRGGQGDLGELLDPDPRRELRGPVHRPQLRRLPGPRVRAAAGRARPGRREPRPLPGRRRRPEPDRAGRGAGRVQGQRRLRHRTRQLRHRRRLPVRAGLLAAHPPGRAGGDGRGRGDRDPAAPAGPGDGHLRRRHGRGCRDPWRPPDPAPGHRRPGGPLARGGDGRRPGRQALRARPALRPGPEPQLGPVGGGDRQRRLGGPAGVVRESHLGLDDWGAGEHAYRSRLHPPGPERPGPGAGEGPWTIEYAVEVTPLEA